MSSELKNNQAMVGTMVLTDRFITQKGNRDYFFLNQADIHQFEAHQFEKIIIKETLLIGCVWALAVGSESETSERTF